MDRQKKGRAGAGGVRGNKKRKMAKYLLTALILIIAVILIRVIADVSGASAGSRDTVFTVDRGDGTAVIADRLEENGLIGSSFLFRVVSRLEDADGEWDYGKHTIPGGSSYKEIIEELTSPQTASIKVTIPEGKQVSQMGTILEEKGICKKKAFMKACTEGDYSDWKFLKGIRTKERINGLEGYLFPDTYYFDENTEPEQVIAAMLARFEEKVYTEKIRKKADKMGFSLDEIVILASMAESEAVTEADRKTVTGVFRNRLERGDRLQSCVTVEYAKRMKKTIISLADTQYDSPYNTYMYPGLPLGPICCPGMVSINAVLYDEDNDYYYFQSDQKGRLHFAESYQEHRAIQKEVQKDWEVTVTSVD